MKAIIIGSGFGGLSAAIDLASRGFEVQVLESASTPGGKASTATVDGVGFDTGPSVLTLPDVFDDLLKLAGTRLRDEVTLVEPTPAFRYHWPDGTTLDVDLHPEATLANVRAALGATAEADLRSFLAYARQIWDTAAPRFVQGPAPSLSRLISLSAIRDMAAIDPMRTMQSAIHRQVKSPHLRDLLTRYATYNGSDPRSAPATLNCIAHVELALGGFGVQGGIQALVDALVRAATKLGVAFTYDTPVRRIATKAGQATGVVTDAGALDATVIVANADVAHVFGTLTDLPPPATARSTSGYTMVVRSPRDPGRAAHSVWFPGRYDREFEDLFDHRRAPEQPTVYLCDQSLAHLRTGWADAVPVFAMANAPADPRVDCTALREQLAARIPGEIVWERTPRELSIRFPGSQGALYGAASNDRFAAFRRPANRVDALRGLYLASGSAHPGGGMPLCALSGRAAALAAAEDSR